MALVTAIVQVQSLAQERLHPTGVAKKERKEGVLLWHNRIGNILGVLGHRFNPWPSTVGKEPVLLVKKEKKRKSTTVRVNLF